MQTAVSWIRGGLSVDGKTTNPDSIKCLPDYEKLAEKIEQAEAVETLDPQLMEEQRKAQAARDRAAFL